jgi:hypothetical protein
MITKSGIDLSVCAYCKTTLDEIWKDIPGYEGKYQASNMGNIKTLDRMCYNHNGGAYFRKSKILTPVINNCGYYHVNLWNNKKKKGIVYRVHILIAMAFLNHNPCGMNVVIDHIDGNKLNNSINNLRTTSQRENASKKSMIKTSKYVGVSFDKSRNKWKASIYIKGKVKQIGRYLCEFPAYIAYNNELKKINNEGIY